MPGTSDQVGRVRVFLASPGDVAEERTLLYEVVEKLRYERPIASVATVDVVAWDDPAGGVPLLANETPQATIDAALVSPGDCDIVVLVLWNRLGTPLPAEHGAASRPMPPRSGTEWEYQLAADAARAHGRPKILIYRRTQGLYLEPHLSREDRHEQLRQLDLVGAFFDALGPDGTHRGVNTYERPEDFARLVEGHMRMLVNDLVAPTGSGPAVPRAAETSELWEGSPFPGLRSFTPADRPIFFGRGRETAQLVDRLRTSAFLAIVGASGSGKSSLVGAGLLPRLTAGLLDPGGQWLVPSFDRHRQRWDGLRVTPAEISSDPLTPLAVQLAPLLNETPRSIIDDLRIQPTGLTTVVRRVLQMTGHTNAVVFIDQFEELFTLIDREFVPHYVDAIAGLVGSGIGTVVLTMRSDFYHQCLEIPALAHLLEQGQFPLPAPTDALYEIVARPADRAGLVFEEGLIDRILADTGHDPNALPLLAFALDELYRRSTRGQLTFSDYESIGGVAGAIATRANFVFEQQLGDLSDVDVAHIFKSLLEVDEVSRVVRRRAPRSAVAPDTKSDRFVRAFVDARLLVQSRTETDDEPTVYVAHEALFSSWTRLRDWIATAADDLRLLRKLQVAVQDWEDNGRADSYLWPHERLEPVYEMMARLEPDLSAPTQTFTRPEHERVIASFRDPDREPYGRLTDGDRLLAIGEPAIASVISCLSSPNKSVREAAATVMWRFGGPAVAPLIEGYVDAQADERLARLSALVRIGDPRATPVFLRATTDSDPRLQAVAIGALETAGGDHGREALEAVARSGTVDARWRAAGSLAAFGEAALPSLVRALSDPDETVQRRAHDAILAIGEVAASALVQELDADDGSHARRAADVLVGLGSAVAPVIEARLAELSAEGCELGLAVINAVGGPTSGEVVARISRQHADACIRALAVEACIRIGTPACVAATVAALEDDDPWVSTIVVRNATAGDRLAAPLGEALRQGPTARGRSLAATALGALRVAGIPVLAQALVNGDGYVAARAALALTRGGRDGVAALIDAVRSPRAHTVAAATMGLSVLGTLVGAEVDALLATPEPSVRMAAARILRGVPPARSIRRLLDLLADPDNDVRASAARSLATFGTAAVPALTRLAMLIKDPRQAEAAAILEAVGAPATEHLVTAAERAAPSERALLAAVLARSNDPRAMLAAIRLGAADQVRQRSTRL